MTATAWSIRRLAFPLPVVLIAAAAWIGVLSMPRQMETMSGTVGLGFAPFVAMWTLMVAAMMLPSIVPFASLYVQTFERDRGWRLGAFVGGYLIIWMLPALPAYAFSWWADQAALTQPSITIVIAVGALAACGIYQLTPYKAQCLQRCRSPLSDAFKYAAYHGRLRDLRVGASHGLHCLGCCWALMALMLSFGLMNVPAMITLAAVCAIEKVWAYGPQFGRFVGVTSLAGAVAVAINPELASWLHTALVICTTQ